MIRTRMGSDVESIVATNTDSRGNVWVACYLKGMSGMREIHLADLRADDGAREVDAAIAALPEDKRLVETSE